MPIEKTVTFARSGAEHPRVKADRLEERFLALDWGTVHLLSFSRL